jgi:histone H3/H4
MSTSEEIIPEYTEVEPSDSSATIATEPRSADPPKRRRKINAIHITRRTMKKLQASTKHMVEESIMNDIIKCIAPDYLFTEKAKEALRTEADAFMNSIMEDVNMFAAHAKRQTAMPDDLHMAIRMAQLKYPGVNFNVKDFKTVQLEKERDMCADAARAKRDGGRRAEKEPVNPGATFTQESYDDICARMDVDPLAHTQVDDLQQCYVDIC